MVLTTMLNLIVPYSIIRRVPPCIRFTGKAKGGAGTITKPSKVAVDELFYLKVQIGDERDSTASPHLVYDKTRECEFFIDPGTPAWAELKAIVKRSGTMGRKAHFKGKFDSKGQIYMCPNLMALKTW